MMGKAPLVTPDLFARLPENLHYTGEPNAWVRMTRPGQRLHSFLEGACFDAAGQLWLVDVPYGRIFRIDQSGNWTLADTYDGEPHSLKPLGDNTFALVDYRRGLLHYNPRNNCRSILASGYRNSAFLGLSDMTVTPDGTIWFTDSGRTSLTDPRGRVFRYRADGALDLILDNVPYPNGIAISPDGKLVYVAATRGNAIWRLATEVPAGPPFPMAGVFLHLSGGLGPDGLAVDKSGRLAVAQAQAGRAYLFDPLGDLLAEIRLPEGLWTTSVAFGGDDQKFLFIVDAQTGSVWRADVSHF